MASVLLFTSACTAAHLLAIVVLHVVLNQPIGAAAEMAARGGPFRDLKDPHSLYYPLLSPIVTALLTRALAVGLFSAPAVAAWSRADGARFALALWSATSAHGIWLDYTVFRISPRILVMFLVSSCVGAACTGALLPLSF
jgi:hypothetical protein